MELPMFVFNVIRILFGSQTLVAKQGSSKIIINIQNLFLYCEMQNLVKYSVACKIVQVLLYGLHFINNSL